MGDFGRTRQHDGIGESPDVAAINVNLGIWMDSLAASDHAGDVVDMRVAEDDCVNIRGRYGHAGKGARQITGSLADSARRAAGDQNVTRAVIDDIGRKAGAHAVNPGCKDRRGSCRRLLWRDAREEFEGKVDVAV